MDNEINPFRDSLKVIWTMIKVVGGLTVIGFSIYLDWQHIMVLGGWKLFIELMVGTGLMIIFSYFISRINQ